MTRDETIKHSKTVWGRMAETGDAKYDTVADLMEEGLLPDNALEWQYRCPFCEEYHRSYLCSCDGCPWPGIGYMRCTDDGSPYDIWENAEGVTPPEEMKAICKAVYELICTMK
jgi:hypothetical protein